VLAGGSRQRLLVWPRPVSFPLVRPIRHIVGYSRLETFPGAACYTTLSSFAFCRAVMPAACRGQKRLPSRCYRTHPKLSFPHFLCRGSNASRNPSPRKFNASNVLPIAIAGKTSNHQ